MGLKWRKKAAAKPRHGEPKKALKKVQKREPGIDTRESD